MDNKDFVLEELAKIGYETMHEDRWRNLNPNSIERKLWEKIADNMLRRLWDLYSEYRD